MKLWTPDFVYKMRVEEAIEVYRFDADPFDILRDMPFTTVVDTQAYHNTTF